MNEIEYLHYTSVAMLKQINVSTSAAAVCWLRKNLCVVLSIEFWILNSNWNSRCWFRITRARSLDRLIINFGAACWVTAFFAETDPIFNGLRLAASQWRGGGSSRRKSIGQVKDLFRKIARTVDRLSPNRRQRGIWTPLNCSAGHEWTMAGVQTQFYEERQGSSTPTSPQESLMTQRCSVVNTILSCVVC